MEDYGKQILSSLPLQILLFFNMYYSTLFFCLNLFLHLYKSYHYHYPYAAFEWEMCMLFLMMFMEMCRLTLASRGNKTEQIPPLVWSIALSFPMICGEVFLLTIQTYVLKLDVILNTVALSFTSAETIISIFTMMSFYRGFTG
jgi:transmembrane protein 216